MLVGPASCVHLVFSKLCLALESASKRASLQERQIKDLEVGHSLPFPLFPLPVYPTPPCIHSLETSLQLSASELPQSHVYHSAGGLWLP